jgi:hypothetical protein
VSVTQHEHEVSLVREAIEAAAEYLDNEPPADIDALYFGHHVRSLLRSAWLSLPKCAVCGNENTVSYLLDYEELPVVEELCEACRPIAHYTGLGKFEFMSIPF